MAEASELQKGSYFVHDGEIFKVIRKEIVVVGTHSHSKLKLFIQPLQGTGQRSIILAHGGNVEILDIIRKTAQVISKSENSFQIMDTHTYETLDGEADKELLDQLEEGNEVTFIDINGQIKVLEKRK